MILVKPEGITSYEAPLATFWFNEDGILYAVAKDTPRTLEKQKETYAVIRKIADNQKVCMLSEASAARIPDEETTKYMNQEIPNLFKAMAVLSETATGKAPTVAANILQSTPVPIHLFDSEEQALEWLKGFL